MRKIIKSTKTRYIIFLLQFATVEKNASALQPIGGLIDKATSSNFGSNCHNCPAKGCSCKPADKSAIAFKLSRLLIRSTARNSLAAQVQFRSLSCQDEHSWDRLRQTTQAGFNNPTGGRYEKADRSGIVLVSIFPAACLRPRFLLSSPERRRFCGPD